MQVIQGLALASIDRTYPGQSWQFLKGKEKGKEKVDSWLFDL